ncbi:hypothetical protein DMP23_22525 [Amycolatopsis sp. A1MSW2902]
MLSNLKAEVKRSGEDQVRKLLSATASAPLSERLDLVADVLVNLDIGLHSSDILSHPLKGANVGRIDIPRCSTTICVCRNLDHPSDSRGAEWHLSRHLVALDRSSRERFVGVVTDGKRWRLYQRLMDGLREVSSASLTMTATGTIVPGRLRSWLEGVLASDSHATPSPREIADKLGATSPSYLSDIVQLRELYQKHRKSPGVVLKRSMWAKLLTTASGENFRDNDELFVDHTLLVVMAEIIGHAVLGFTPGNLGTSAADVLSGKFFEEAQIGGVVEADFFDWIAEVPGGDLFVNRLVRKLGRFNWSEVRHDILKVLYESIIPQDVRHRLGEYYTPDWLAEEVICDRVSDPLSEKVLDASCGSGTFLFHAVRRCIAAAVESGATNAEAIKISVANIMGFDVHPVAVTLARVTYLLAIGADRLRQRERPAFSVPVYLGDSIRWGDEASLFTHRGLSIPTDLDHADFVTDSSLMSNYEAASKLDFPDEIVADADSFDRLVAELARLATDRKRNSAVPSLKGLLKRFSIKSEEHRNILRETFSVMCSLHDQGRNHIWGYYIRNLARPIWMNRKENRVDVLVGNPPWLAYRYMTVEQKRSFRAMADQRGLWHGGGLASNQDLSALFTARCIELYLRTGGLFGYVMPLSVLSRGQYKSFRSADFSTAAADVRVAFDRPWDLSQIKPAFFPQSVGVVLGRRVGEISPARRMPVEAEAWSGRFDTQASSAEAARDHVTRIRSEKIGQSTPSPYKSSFREGATVVPRLLFMVDKKDDGPLGSGAGRCRVKSRRSSFEKRPWKHLPGIEETIESQFIRPLYTGEFILPYRSLKPVDAIVPWDGSRLLGATAEDVDLYPGLARWWRAANKLWMENRANDNLSLLDRVDYHRGLSRQFSGRNIRVVYTKSGMYMAAAMIVDPEAVIDHKLFWADFDDLDEARFLVSILNSEELLRLIKPLQGRGEHNPRDFDKHVFNVPIPRFDPKNPLHLDLVDLALRAQNVASEVDVAHGSFQVKRRKVRDALSLSGISGEIDAIVKKVVYR